MKRIQRRIEKYPSDDTNLIGSKVIDYTAGSLNSFNIDWCDAQDNTLKQINTGKNNFNEEIKPTSDNIEEVICRSEIDLGE